jgi:hypothetical protein
MRPGNAGRFTIGFVSSLLWVRRVNGDFTLYYDSMEVAVAGVRDFRKVATIV